MVSNETKLDRLRSSLLLAQNILSALGQETEFPNYRSFARFPQAARMLASLLTPLEMPIMKTPFEFQQLLSISG